MHNTCLSTFTEDGLFTKYCIPNQNIFQAMHSADGGMVVEHSLRLTLQSPGITTKAHPTMHFD